MVEFKATIEDFAVTMDALRDFVASIGPLLVQRQEQVAEAAKGPLTGVQLAFLIAGRLDTLLPLQEALKEELAHLRSFLTGADPEKNKERFEHLRTVTPVRIVAGKIEVDWDDARVRQTLDDTKVIDRVKKEISLLNESALMALTSRSEWFIAQLIHLYLSKFPEAAGKSEPFFSLEGLSALRTIEDARDVLIEDRVEALMRKSFEDWLKFFREKPKLSMGYLDGGIERIAEVFKRRNLIVHNGGRVSRRYFQEVSPDLRGGLDLGAVIQITPEYLNSCIDLTEQYFVLVAAELWKRLDPADAAPRNGVLVRLSVEHLGQGHWLIARGFSRFAMEDKNGSQADQLRSTVNYWQTFKWSGHFDEVRLEIEKWDVSAANPMFRVARAALIDDFGVVFSLLPELLKSGDLMKHDLQTWPLFKAVREQPEYLAHTLES